MALKVSTYHVSVRLPLPTNIRERLSAAHAEAVKALNLAQGRGKKPAKT
jgi:hypothetical protein